MYTIDPLKCYLIGGAIITVSVIAHSQKKKRLASWIGATATVQNIRRPDQGDVTVTVRFTDAGGQLRTAWVKVADEDSVSLGSEVEIAYNPRNPEEAFVREAKDMKLSLYIPLAAGSIVLGLGVYAQLVLSRG